MNNVIFGITLIARVLVMEHTTNYLSQIIYGSDSNVVYQIIRHHCLSHWTLLRIEIVSLRLSLIGWMNLQHLFMTDVSVISTPYSKSTLSSHGIEQTDPKAVSIPKTTKSKPHKQTQRSHPKERITVLNINCRSIKNKIPELYQVIEQTKRDIIACTETWLKPEIKSSDIFPDNLGYNIFRDDRVT